MYTTNAPKKCVTIPFFKFVRSAGPVLSTEEIRTGKNMFAKLALQKLSEKYTDLCFLDAKLFYRVDLTVFPDKGINFYMWNLLAENPMTDYNHMFFNKENKTSWTSVFTDFKSIAEINFSYSDDIRNSLQTCCDNNKSFIAIPLLIDVKESEKISHGHANIIIIDVKNRIIERFEPHDPRLDFLKLYEPKLLDKKIESIFKHICGQEFIYNKIYGGIQLEHLTSSTSESEVVGYCHTWIFMYLEYRLAFPYLESKNICKNIIECMRQYRYTPRQFIQLYHRYLMDFFEIYNSRQSLNYLFNDINDIEKDEDNEGTSQFTHNVIEGGGQINIKKNNVRKSRRTKKSIKKRR